MSTLIHPSAVVDAQADLHPSVEVGAFTIIDADVRIGEGTVIGPHVVLKGPTRIGKFCRIFQFSSIGEAPQDLKYAGEPTRLEIGDHNVIRESCTLNRGTVSGGGVTRIGDHNLLMAYVHIAHDCQIGNQIIFANCASLGGHVHVCDQAILGGFTIVHQFTRLGAHCFCGMGSLISKDVPPYLTVSGAPAKPHGINSEGLRRRSFSPTAITALQRAYKLLYRSSLTVVKATEQMQAMCDEFPEIKPLVDFVSTKGRGIVR